MGDLRRLAERSAESSGRRPRLIDVRLGQDNRSTSG